MRRYVMDYRLLICILGGFFPVIFTSQGFAASQQQTASSNPLESLTLQWSVQGPLVYLDKGVPAGFADWDSKTHKISIWSIHNTKIHVPDLSFALTSSPDEQAITAQDNAEPVFHWEPKVASLAWGDQKIMPARFVQSADRDSVPSAVRIDSMLGHGYAIQIDRSLAYRCFWQDMPSLYHKNGRYSDIVGYAVYIPSMDSQHHTGTWGIPPNDYINPTILLDTVKWDEASDQFRGKKLTISRLSKYNPYKLYYGLWREDGRGIYSIVLYILVFIAHMGVAIPLARYIKRWLKFRGVAGLVLCSYVVMILLGHVLFWGFLLTFNFGFARDVIGWAVILCVVGLYTRKTFRHYLWSTLRCQSVRIPLIMILLVGILYLSVLHTHFCKSSEYMRNEKTNQQETGLRLRGGLIAGDNYINKLWIFILYEQGWVPWKVLLAPKTGSTLADRLPGLAGITLLYYHHVPTHFKNLYYLSVGTFLSLAWIPACWLFLRTVRVRGRLAMVIIFILSLVGCIYYESVYTVPKLPAGAFAVGIFVYMVLRPWLTRRRPKKANVFLAGLMGVGALLCHNNVLILLAPMAVAIVLIPRLFPGWKNICIGMLTLIIALSPYFMVKSKYEKKVSTLVRNIVGNPEYFSNDRSTWETIYASYTKTPPGDIITAKWDNILSMFVQSKSMPYLSSNGLTYNAIFSPILCVFLLWFGLIPLCRRKETCGLRTRYSLTACRLSILFGFVPLLLFAIVQFHSELPLSTQIISMGMVLLMLIPLTICLVHQSSLWSRCVILANMGYFIWIMQGHVLGGMVWSPTMTVLQILSLVLLMYYTRFLDWLYAPIATMMQKRRDAMSMNQ